MPFKFKFKYQFIYYFYLGKQFIKKNISFTKPYLKKFLKNLYDFYGKNIS